MTPDELFDFYDARYPRASDCVDGLDVTEEIPNLSSISASFHEWEELGVRVVPMADFTMADPIDVVRRQWTGRFASRVESLAEQIDDNSWLDPLIVVVDDEGPWILEGGHRFDALRILGREHFPALVVVSYDDD